MDRELNREYERWCLVERWIDELLFNGTLRLNDIPRELRISCDTFYTTAFRISRNISITWFVQNLRLLEYDIMATAKGSKERKTLLDMLSFNLDLFRGEKKIVDYKESMDEEILQELSERRGAKQAMLRTQLEQYRDENGAANAKVSANQE